MSYDCPNLMKVKDGPYLCLLRHYTVCLLELDKSCEEFDQYIKMQQEVTEDG